MRTMIERFFLSKYDLSIFKHSNSKGHAKIEIPATSGFVKYARCAIAFAFFELNAFAVTLWLSYTNNFT